MIIYRDQNIGRNHNIKFCNKFLESLEHLKYLGTTQTYQNSIHDEVKSRLTSENVCYLSVQNLLSSSLLSKNIKIKTYRITVFVCCLCGCKTWPLTLRDKHRLCVFGNRVLRKIIRLKRDEVTGEWKRLHNGVRKGLCLRELFADRINETIQVTDNHKRLHRGPRVHGVLLYYIIYSTVFFFSFLFLVFMERQSFENKK